MTTYARARAHWDTEHERDLAKAIFGAIASASKVSDADVTVLRTGEIAAALIDALALTLAISPSAARTRQARRQLLLDLGRRLQRRTAEAVADPGLQDFLRRHDFNLNVRGHA